jgi:hypothetical protein
MNENKRALVAAPAHSGRGKKLPDLIRRQRALEKTRDRFAGRVIDLGVTDCIILGRKHLVHMGHKHIPAPGKYRTPKEAADRLKAICKKVGAKKVGLEPLFDALLPRIAPAEMLPGDIGLVEQEDGSLGVSFGSIVVSVGTKFWGWHPDDERFALIEPHGMPFKAAWRA